MKFPIIEIVDRYAISVVKYEKTSGANQSEFDFYLEQMKQANVNPAHPKILELIEHHSYVWSLEDDVKKGRVDNLPLEEIGKRCLHIRDLGIIRTRLKNALAEFIDIDDVREVKKDHISETI
jgi:hypothetical protein